VVILLQGSEYCTIQTDVLALQDALPLSLKGNISSDQKLHVGTQTFIQPSEDLSGVTSQVKTFSIIK